MSADDQERRYADALARERKALSKGECPYTSERLTAFGNVQIPKGTLSCSMCDCFGYRPGVVVQPGEAPEGLR